jgi:hypothetical protein
VGNEKRFGAQLHTSIEARREWRHNDQTSGGEIPTHFEASSLHASLRRAGVRSCRIVTRAGNARSFPLCSPDITTMAAAEAYAGFRVGEHS